MARSKASISAAADADGSLAKPSTVAHTTTTPAVATSSSKLPSQLRFALVALMSFSISALLYSFQGTVGDYELATITRHLEGWEFTVGVLGWKLVELGISWYGGFDDLDLAALTILTRTPYLWLIYSFYNISLYTVLSSLVIDVVAVALPTRLLRSRSPTHLRGVSTAAVPNRNLIQDSVVVAIATLLGASVYSTTIFTGLKTFLPSFLVTYFDDMRTLEPAYTATLASLTVSFLPLGWAVREFVLDPSLGYEAQLTVADHARVPFNPETATLGQTIRYNLWGYEKRTKVLLHRTATAVALILTSTTMQVYGRIQGAELIGAAGYAALWTVPGIYAMVAFQWVGAV